MVNKKEVCPECKRKLRTKCFVFNKLRKKKICRQCDKRIGNNKFYVPFSKKKDFIGKYSINEEEKKKLWGKYVREGCSYQQAWRKVYYLIGGLRRQRKQKATQRRGNFLDKMKQTKQKQEMKEKFIEGLKNG